MNSINAEGCAQPRNPRKSPHTGVIFTVGKKRICCNASQIDPVPEKIRSACRKSSRVVLQVLRLTDFMPAQRRALFEFVKELGGVSVEVNGTRFDDPFDGFVHSIKWAGLNIAAQKNVLATAVEAAAVFHADEPSFAAAFIKQKLADAGLPKIPQRRLLRLINELSEQGPFQDEKEGNVINPTVEANAYIDYLRGEGNIGTDEWPIIYFCERFYLYRGTRWERMEDRFLEADVTKFLQHRNCPSLTRSLVGDVINNLRGLVLVAEWSTAPPFFIATFSPLSFGTPKYIALEDVLLETGEAMSEPLPPIYLHTPKWFSEAVLPFPYDPEAQCPAWLSFLDCVLPKTHEQDNRQLVLEEFLGYCLLYGCDFEKMLVLVGDGANGKSVVLNTIINLLGKTNVANIPFDVLCSEFRAVGLRGKTANVSNEIAHLGKINEGVLKQLVSGQPIDANEKYKAPRTMVSHAKLIVATNQLPSFSDATDGIWRRLIVIPFEVRIAPEDQDHGLSEQLKQELPGIFNRALAGLRRLIEQNGFTSCSKCNYALTQHRLDSCTVADFFRVCCARAHEGQLYPQRLYEIYSLFTRQRGRKPHGANEFGKRIKILGTRRVRGAQDVNGHRPWVYAGVRLNPEGVDWMQRLIQKEAPGWTSAVYIAP